MSNKYAVPIGVLIGAILIIAGTYIALNPNHQGSLKTDNNNGSYIEHTQKFIPDVKIQEEELKKTANLQLKIGSKYRYKYRFTIPLNLTIPAGGESNKTKNVPDVNMKMSGSTNIVVDRKERFNKSDVFVLKYNSISRYENIDEIMNMVPKRKEMTQEEMQKKMMYVNMLKKGMNISGEIWINNDGKTVKAITYIFGMKITTEGKNAGRGMPSGPNPSMMIQPWMLALSKDFEWTRNATLSMKGFKTRSTERYKVAGIEEIDTKTGKRKCYKVEEEGISSMNAEKSNKKFSGKTILWIDYNERILIKAESWMKNLKIGSIELVYEKI